MLPWEYISARFHKSSILCVSFQELKMKSKLNLIWRGQNCFYIVFSEDIPLLKNDVYIARVKLITIQKLLKSVNLKLTIKNNKTSSCF